MHVQKAPQHILINSSKSQMRLSSAHLLGWILLVETTILFFVPKLNIIPIPGFSVQAKPEDLLWLIIFPFLITQRWHIRNHLSLSFFIIILYLGTSIIWHPSNALLVARLFFYSFPLLLAVIMTNIQLEKLGLITQRFLYLMAAIAILQTTTPFPFFHTGELYFGPTERSPGIYGNGVEFALMAFFAFWILHFMSRSSWTTWMAALVIALLSGTRMVTLALLVSGLVFFRRDYTLRILGIISIAVIMTIAIFSSLSSNIEIRLIEVDFIDIFNSIINIYSSFSPTTVSFSNMDGYCFDFDDSLSLDQSFAMRLSKLSFVVEAVVLGNHSLGFGLGKCIGDAGDNLFVRVLSDGGLPYFFLLIFFLFKLFTQKLITATITNGKLFFTLLIMVSLFYDILYFSRVAPFLFIIISVIRSTSANNLSEEFANIKLVYSNQKH